MPIIRPKKVSVQVPNPAFSTIRFGWGDDGVLGAADVSVSATFDDGTVEVISFNLFDLITEQQKVSLQNIMAALNSAVRTRIQN